MTSPLLRACYERAIHLEQAVQKYYLRIADNFAFEAGIRTAFLDLASDEAEHAKALSTAILSGPRKDVPETDALDILQRLEKLYSRLSAMLSNAYGDFAAAFRIAEEIEHSEVNNIFLLLVSGRLGSTQDAASHKEMMSRHVQKVADLGAKYPPSDRAKILPRMQ
jgi:rubrerythrin